MTLLIAFLIITSSLAGCIGDNSSEEVSIPDTSNLEERIETLEQLQAKNGIYVHKGRTTDGRI